MIKAEVIADSRNEFGNRLTTMVVTFPRYILAEFNTHRMLSKNSASSRAIPFMKLVESVNERPFIPMAWQKNHSGMQGTEYCTQREAEVLTSAWLVARNKAVEQVMYMASYANPTKQLINRLLEPFMYHTCIVSGTEWENFFALRCPQYTFGDISYRSKKDAIVNEGLGGKSEGFNQIQWLTLNKGAADIHMMALAEAMWDAYNESTPKELKAGEWHIPFGDQIDPEELGAMVGKLNLNDGKGFAIPLSAAKVRIATARCAGVSYTVVGEDGKPASYEKLIARHDNLAKMGHWSPFEHCARAMTESEYWYWTKQSGKGIEGISDDALTHLNGGWSGNFRGFIQYRKMFDNENITK